MHPAQISTPALKISVYFEEGKKPNNLSSVRSFLPVPRPRSVGTMELQEGGLPRCPPALARR